MSRIDRDGRAWETIVDVIGAGASLVDLIRNPSWGNAGWFVADLGAVFVPFVPGTKTGPFVGRIVVRMRSADDPAKAFRRVRKFSADNFRQNLQRLTHGKAKRSIMKGYDAHHLIPVKFHTQLKRMGSQIDPNNP